MIIAKLDNTVNPMLSRGLLNNGFVVITRGLLIPLLLKIKWIIQNSKHMS